MCGITGYWRWQKDMGADALHAVAAPMADALARRGPDSEGFWTNTELGLALAHRRLSIIDTSSAGAQPMISADGGGIITVNAEIYNFEALRAELEAAGAAPAWRGHSDTEVLLAALRHWGVAATLPKLNGMFAFAYVDVAARKLYLARDRFGEKPLYIYQDENALAFASELKAIKTLPHFNGALNRAAVAELMAYAYVPAPHSIYAHARKLPPATYLEINLAAASPVISPPITYWSAWQTAYQSQRLASPDEMEATQQLDTLLRQSVNARMMADVPLGAFLSGGIDSSIVVAMMQAQSTRPIKTYSIGFAEANYNEAHYARAVAAHLGTDHTEHIVSPVEAMSVIPNLATIYDEPFADSSQIPTYLVSKLARQQVTVALSGDAGDELFGGYNRYSTGAKLWRMLAPFPRAMRTAIARAMTSIPPANIDAVHAAFTKLIPKLAHLKRLGDKTHKLAGLLDASDGHVLYHRLHTFWPLQSIVPGHRAAHQTIDGVGDLADDMMLHDTINYLPNDILVKLDRASMAVSLESRVPLLDPELFSFAWSLDPKLKIRNGKGKYLLRQVLNRYVPEKLIDRPKMGFGVPIGDWLRGPLRDWAEDLLRPSKLGQDGVLLPNPIAEKWQEHLSGRRNWQHHLWPVLMFQAWREA